MALVYDTFGPFDVSRDGNKVRRPALVELWKQVFQSEPHLAGAVGVYIIAIRGKKGSAPKPWYVGKTDRQSFKGRLGQQLTRFGDVLDCAPRGQVQVFLLARITPQQNRFVSPAKHKLSYNDELESLVIGACLSKNPQLINASKVKHLKGLIVPGFLNDKRGKRKSSASELKRMLASK